MKRIDFENGTVTGNILGAALPMLAAQLLNLLYNIVDRVYIARIPHVGTAALGAVGICFPLIMIITAFANLFGGGGAPLFSIYRGKKEEKTAVRIMNTSFSMICASAVLLMIGGFLFAYPVLILGMNPFINAQGYSVIGMSSVVVGAAANLILDPVFIFILGLGVRGAAIATVLSQTISAIFVYFFLSRRAELKVRLLRREEIGVCSGYARNIVSLGMAGFIMQLTNSLVSICCNHVLSVTGGDIYISVMTIISSVRQLVETPISAINEGTSPILSYNYGARRPGRVRKAMVVLAVMILLYTAVMWGSIIVIPEVLIRIFSSDKMLLKDAVPALRQYFAAFIFMDLQYMGQTVFKSLNKKKQAIFFSILRKVVIVVPLTYFMPYALHMGTDGVFLAEPVSNVIGGSICFITMLCTVLPELKRMEARK